MRGRGRARGRGRILPRWAFPIGNRYQCHFSISISVDQPRGGACLSCPSCLSYNQAHFSLHAGRMPRTPPLCPCSQRETHPKTKHRVLGAAPGKLSLDLPKRVDAWHSPGSIEIPSDEITKQPAATPDEVTRIEGQERVLPSVLSDPPRSDSISIRRARRNLDLDLDWTSTRARTWFCPWLARGRPRHHDSRPEQRPGKLASQPSWSGAHDGARPSSIDKGSKDPLSHAARDIPPRSTRPPAVPTCKKTHLRRLYSVA